MGIPSEMDFAFQTIILITSNGNRYMLTINFAADTVVLAISSCKYTSYARMDVEH